MKVGQVAGSQRGTSRGPPPSTGHWLSYASNPQIIISVVTRRCDVAKEIPALRLFLGGGVGGTFTITTRALISISTLKMCLRENFWRMKILSASTEFPQKIIPCDRHDPTYARTTAKGLDLTSSDVCMFLDHQLVSQATLEPKRRQFPK
ncbi:hypothetical protein Trydic_g5890 [Trypoxylus dichotomus]